MATFNIGAQNAASIQNIGGDAVIQGGLYAHASFEIHELRVAIADAREHAADMELPPEVRGPLDRALASAADEAARERPDKGRLANLLGTAARTLTDAGTVATAGTALIQTLRRAAMLLGPVGQAALALL
jgi:hypothetical protein